MVRWIWLVLAAVGLIAALAGCAETSAVPTASPARAAPKAYPELLARWLGGVPCRAPCWEGITPGQTTWAEALELLRASQLIDQARFPSAQSEDEVDWNWVGERYGGLLRTSSGTVSMILVDLPEDVLLRDVIAAYGEPSHVAAAAFRGDHGDGPFYIFSLAWEPAGFALEAGSLYTEKPILGPDLPFHKLYFSTSPDIILPGVSKNQRLLPWEGFKEFDAYCRGEADQPCP
ncbi:MAG TPA: hypothetical protein VD886_14945 [Herpetosiphonaceae bacterium]|nr:hypothetical protein [Herpetosiphonaceae bacterium]